MFKRYLCQLLFFSIAFLILFFHVYHQLGFDLYQHDVVLQRSKSSELVQRCVLGCINPKTHPNTKQSTIKIGDVLFHQGVVDTVGFPPNLPIVVVDYQLNRTNFVLEWKTVQKSDWLDMSERYSYSNVDGHLRIKVFESGYLTLLTNWLTPFDSFHYWRLNSCLGSNKVL
ncbi:predicted protein [Naegleria gruberi]|uniref:Predicted protein n=1 Tax=Naegleria gruberi TaxID=5762 RepID=D2VL21_NAEGR|nr:uncharacterized protein NAEGRDRAFT_69633 [Naegleria gruberi]EFC42461.1 predicted protein [Naegleria gruberi]|eukprot:XP_002675205.1 predicted protein [Naegleria gruberi strain NEG-M]